MLLHIVFAICYTRGDLRLLTPANLATAAIGLLDSALLGQHPSIPQQRTGRQNVRRLCTEDARCGVIEEDQMGITRCAAPREEEQHHEHDDAHHRPPPLARHRARPRPRRRRDSP